MTDKKYQEARDAKYYDALNVFLREYIYKWGSEPTYSEVAKWAAEYFAKEIERICEDSIPLKHHEAMLAVWEAKVLLREKELTEAKDAIKLLREYGDHTIGCIAWWDNTRTLGVQENCNCGLLDALEQTKKWSE